MTSEPAGGWPALYATPVTCRDATDPVVDVRCDYWPTDLGGDRAVELGLAHEGHPVETCLVQLAVMARLLHPHGRRTGAPRTMYLTADPSDWPRLVRENRQLTRKVTVLPGDGDDLALIKAAHATRTARARTLPESAGEAGRSSPAA